MTLRLSSSVIKAGAFLGFALPPYSPPYYSEQPGRDHRAWVILEQMIPLIPCPLSAYWPLPAAGVSGSMVFCLENKMPHRLLGSAMVHFHASEVQQLLHNKFVVILGDSSE